MLYLVFNKLKVYQINIKDNYHKVLKYKHLHMLNKIKVKYNRL
jgi:hypothetical protein